MSQELSDDFHYDRRFFAQESQVLIESLAWNVSPVRPICLHLDWRKFIRTQTCLISIHYSPLTNKARLLT